MKKEVFKRAWNLFNNAFGTFSECLKQAWKAVKLKAKMTKGIVEFEFVKSNGDVRKAFGTLTQSISKGKGKPSPLSIIAFLDTEINQIRSFKIDSLC